MDKILSVCIASYNKAETTTNLVKSLLTCTNPELEVVVVDNASTDDTVDRLSTITDDRFHFKKNESNIGGAKNFVASVLRGKGKYCFYTNDRDVVYPEKLDSFIKYLKDNSHIGGGHCVRNIIPDIKGCVIEHKGIDALLTINFRGEHPTGFFFKRSLLNDIPNEIMEQCGVNEPYLSFPWEGFLCDIICKGNTVVQYNDVIWKSTGDTTHVKYQSEYYIGNEEDRWFFPKNRLNLTITETRETLKIARNNDIILNTDDRYRLYAHLLGPQYTFAVYRYKVIYETSTLAYHYKVPHRKVGKKELENCKREMIDGFLSYVREEENGINEKESYIIDGMKAIDMKYRMTIRRFLGLQKNKILSLFKIKSSK